MSSKADKCCSRESDDLPGKWTLNTFFLPEVCSFCWNFAKLFGTPSLCSVRWILAVWHRVDDIASIVMLWFGTMKKNEHIPGFWVNVLDSFSCLSFEIAYSNFTFCGAYMLSFLEHHTISAKRAHHLKCSTHVKENILPQYQALSPCWGMLFWVFLCCFLITKIKDSALCSFCDYISINCCWIISGISWAVSLFYAFCSSVDVSWRQV